MNTIWIINHYAAINNGRHPSLAKFFIEKGFDTCIILSSFDHSKREYLFKEQIRVITNEDGVKYVYVHSKPEYKSNGVGRILNMISFCRILWSNIKQIKEQVGPPDFVIASSVHPFVWEIGYRLKKKYNTKFIAEIRDIWPLSLMEVANVNKHHPFIWLLEKVEMRAYKRADAIVSTMPYAYKYICKNFPIDREKIYWMPNGIDVQQYEKNLKSEKLIPAELDKFLNAHWCCVYTGSLVESECIPMMLDAFAILKEEDIYFAIIGDGHDVEMLKNKKDVLALDKVCFFPFVNQNIIGKIIEKSKCCIGAIQDKPIYRFGLSLNKLNDYLISGKPVVFACNYDNVVKDAGQFAIPSDAPDVMAETLKKIRSLDSDSLVELAENSKALIKEQYDYKVVSENYLKLLASL